jgi:hypothetical protein
MTSRWNQVAFATTWRQIHRVGDIDTSMVESQKYGLLADHVISVFCSSRSEFR